MIGKPLHKVSQIWGGGGASQERGKKGTEHVNAWVETHFRICCHP